ncbi:MAG: hypothetical protein WC708_07540 [Lentisphaeria bacterium]
MYKWMINFTAFVLAAAGALGGEKKLYAWEEDLGLPDPGWRFEIGAEFPGAAGRVAMAPRSAAASDHILVLDADFTHGGGYVGAGKTFATSLEIRELRFQVKTPARKIGLRLGDAGGQTHQQYISLSGDPKAWQPITVKTLGGAPAAGFIHWGGANNGVVKQPLRSVMFVAGNGEAAGQRWQTQIRQITWLTPTAPRVRLKAKPLAFWLTPGSREPLRLAVSALPDDRVVRFAYTDYQGAPAAGGTLAVAAGQQALTVPPPRKNGYYDLAIPELGLTAGVVVLPPYAGEPDPFFAIGSMFTCFGGSFDDDAVVDSYFRLLRRSGICWARDAIPWMRLEWERGRFDWEIRGSNGDDIRRLGAENRINMLDFFQEAPPWTGSVDSATEKYPYPRDLTATADSWVNIMRHWNRCGALEIWNEPDISLGAGLPGDHLCAVQKTLSYAFRANRIPTELVGGVFTGTCIDPGFIGIYLDNGLLDDSDAFSFHNYETPDRLAPLVAKFRHLFRDSGKQEIPLWITECGKPWPAGTEKAGLSDDQASAFGIVMKAVEAKACGVAKYFAFIYPYYDEGLNNFGMVDKNQAPMRSMAAYAWCASALSRKQYIGDLKGVDCAYARVFSDGHEAVAVLGAPAPAATVTLPVGLDISRIAGADGRALSASGNQLRLDNEPVYVFCRPAAVAPFLNTDTVSLKLLTAAQGYRSRPRQARPVVFQPDLNLREYLYTIYGYRIDHPAQTQLAVKINNLSDQPLTVRPVVSTVPAAGLAGLSETPVTIQPRSFVRLAFTADIRDALKKAKAVKVTVADRDNQATPLVFTLLDGKKVCVPAVPAVAADQTFDPTQAGGKGWTDITSWRNWGPGQGPSRIQARFRVCWTADTLQLQVRVEDNTYCQPQPIHDAWQGDSIQAAFYRVKPGVEQLKATEITAAQTPAGPEIFCHESVSGKTGLLKASKLRFYAKGNQCLYVIDLDANEMDLGRLATGTEVALSILVNSNEGAGREGYLYWGDGIGLSKNPKELNRVKLGR